LRKRYRSLDVHLIPTDDRSKISRLLAHIDTVNGGRIRLPQDAAWREEWETEFEQFPHGPFDDQVDAFTQALDFINQHPDLRKTRGACVGLYRNARGVARFASPTLLASSQTPYAALGRGGRLKRIFPERA